MNKFLLRATGFFLVFCFEVGHYVVFELQQSMPDKEGLQYVSMLRDVFTTSGKEQANEYVM